MAEARGEPPEGEEWPEIDRVTLPIRVPDDILYRLLKEALARNDDFCIKIWLNKKLWVGSISLQK